MPTISTLTVDVESNTSRFSKGLKLATAGLGVLAAAAGYAFKQFEDSEKVANQTDAVLKSTGKSANVTAREVTSLANALSRKAGIDDEAIQTGENMLLTFTSIRNEVGKGNDIFNQATKSVLDMSVAMGQDMKSSAIQVGKALNDPVAGITALTRVGVKFDEETKKQIETLVKHGQTLEAQKIILHELNTEFAGSAEAQATASGKMGVALGNLAEKIGGLLAPAVTFLIDEFLKLVKFLQGNIGPALEAVQEWLAGVWEKVQPVAEGIGNILIPMLEAAWKAIQAHLVPALERLWEAFGPILKVLGAAALAFGVVLVAQVLLLVTALSHLIDWFSKLVDWVRENLAEPIVGAIQKILDWLQKAGEWVRDKFASAWQAVKGPVLAVIDAFVSAIQTLIGWIKTAIEFVGQLGQGVSQAVAERGAAAGVFGGVKPPVGSNAAGGVVTRTGIARVHRGESIVPGGTGMGTGDIVIQVDGRALARVTRDELRKMGGRNAGTGL